MKCLKNPKTLNNQCFTFKLGIIILINLTLKSGTKLFIKVTKYWLTHNDMTKLYCKYLGTYNMLTIIETNKLTLKL